MEILQKLAKRKFYVEICGKRGERVIEEIMLGPVFFIKCNFKGQKQFSASEGHSLGEGWLSLIHSTVATPQTWLFFFGLLHGSCFLVSLFLNFDLCFATR